MITNCSTLLRHDTTNWGIETSLVLMLAAYPTNRGKFIQPLEPGQK